MGTWIEIPSRYTLSWYLMSFPAMGTWIEIFLLHSSKNSLTVVPCNGNVDWNAKVSTLLDDGVGRSLQWERGLKFVYSVPGRHAAWSFPAMGTWIEIPISFPPNELPATSFPAMGTWIEIVCTFCTFPPPSVVPCNGNVDWNSQYYAAAGKFIRRRSLQWERGLKYPCRCWVNYNAQSFPAMGTWIEIRHWSGSGCWQSASFPAMGTWIEIMASALDGLSVTVVPCNGNVDWNVLVIDRILQRSVVPCNGNVDWNKNGFGEKSDSKSRSLQWERGLKSFNVVIHP